MGKNNIARLEQGLHPQALFPIIQWVIYDDLRIESTKFIKNLDLPGIAIWWLSVWEKKRRHVQNTRYSKRYSMSDWKTSIPYVSRDSRRLNWMNI